MVTHSLTDCICICIYGGSGIAIPLLRLEGYLDWAGLLLRSRALLSRYCSHLIKLGNYRM